MTNMEENQDYEWISKAKLKGPIPFLDPNRCQNGAHWSSPPANAFMVRGPKYSKTKAKIPGGDDYLLKPLAFDWIKGPSKISNLLSIDPRHRVRRAIEDASSKGHKPFVWAFNFQLPTKDHHSIIAYFMALEPFPSHSLTSRFQKGNNKFKNSRLKLIVNIAKAPWIVTKAIGEQAISLIGRALTCSYHLSENFIEVDIDVGSSMVASAMTHLSFRYFKNLTADLAFVIECQEESEFPEQILGAVRFSGLDDNLAGRVEEINGANNY